MGEPIDLTQQALDALASSGLGNDSPAEAFVIGYRNGWQQAVDLCIRIETAPAHGCWPPMTAAASAASG